mmetsp:Transcript_36064/g.82828  ORF Transcript_36064/g.82828 Transcript_36064/m.82828 type:complete len:133 (-) Transcript_36064:64-462(-)
MSVVQGRPIEPGPVVMGQALPEPVQATYVTPPIQQNVYKADGLPRKPRTLLDPCPVPWDETPTRRCVRYLVAAMIVLALLAGAAYLLYSFVRDEEECSSMNDDRQACEANSRCRWYGDSRRNSHNGENCAQT